MADDRRPRPYSRQTIALLDLMRQAGFTNEEFAKLVEAKTHSDALTSTEFAAMKLIEATATPTDADRLKAFMMVRDDAYLRAKAGIMQPIHAFYQMMDQRTLDTIHVAQSHANYLRMAFIAFGLLLILAIWRNYQALLVILGAPATVLYKHISQLGGGHF